MLQPASGLCVKDVQAAREHFRQLGIAVDETTMIPGADRFFVHDPDGNRIEDLQWLEPYDRTRAVRLSGLTGKFLPNSRFSPFFVITSADAGYNAISLRRLTSLTSPAFLLQQVVAWKVCSLVCFLIGLILVLAFVTVVGHGIWVMVAAIFGSSKAARRGPRSSAHSPTLVLSVAARVFYAPTKLPSSVSIPTAGPRMS